jgi:acetylornithine/succinyldiaminopimelate/putrescine aminotransferase
MDLLKRDKKYLARTSDSNDIQIIKSQGSYLIANNNKKYIDFLTGWCVGNIGWGNKQIIKAIKDYNGPDYVSPSFLYQPWVELAELLAQITPGKLTKSFRATGGTEAVEIALRAANALTKRHKFLSIEGSYHGDSIGTMSIGASEFHDHHKDLLFRGYKIKPPLNTKTLDQVEKILARKDVAALIMEPIICNLAVIIPENDFMQGIQKACKKYGTLLIIDEVATGFGRTGKMFASEHFNLQPDIICLAKAISGGYGALGAVVTTKEVAKAMEFESSFYSTYGWHPLSVTAAIANIQFFLNNKDEIFENAAMISQYFSERLTTMAFKSKTKIRICGLAIGIEFESSQETKRIVNGSRKKGLLLSKHSENEITIFPALNIKKAIVKQGLDIIESCIK